MLVSNSVDFSRPLLHHYHFHTYIFARFRHGENTTVKGSNNYAILVKDIKPLPPLLFSPTTDPALIKFIGEYVNKISYDFNFFDNYTKKKP